MKLRSFFSLFLFSIVVIAQAQQSTPIPIDKNVHIGQLENGLTYYIRYNAWPQKRANFYIVQKVGSIQEEESQRGLAHFLEHMCFNGTKNFPGNQVIKYCESLGVQFGQDINAYTAIDQTVYNIDNVPTTRQSALDSCLLILHDWANELTLDPVEIDKERGVIHEEWRQRTSASNRMLERNLPKIYPGSKYGVRYPMGLMSVVDNFKYKELRDYYEKWYHPSNQALIVVGDIDVEHTEKMIKQLFGDIKNPENQAQIIDESVPDNDDPIVIIDKDFEMRSCSLDLMIKHDAYPDSLKGDISYLVYQYVQGAVLSMLNKRYAEAALKTDCPYVSASASDGNFIFAKTKSAFSLSAAPKDVGRIEECLQSLFMEARRAAEQGFTPTEFERYKASTLGYLEKAYTNRDNLFNMQLCNTYKNHFLTNEPIISVDDYYGLMKQIVASVPLQSVNDMMRELLPSTNRNMVILNFNNARVRIKYPTEAQLLNAIHEARQATLPAYVDHVKTEPLITELPKPGKIKKEIHNDKFGYTELKLSNGITVLLEKTLFKKDQVVLVGEGGSGASLYGPEDYTNTNVFNGVIGISGLGKYTSSELSKALAGKMAKASLSMDERNMMVSANATPNNVETMLQLVHLKFTDIRKDEKAFNGFMNRIELSLKNRSLTAETALSDSITATLYGHNPRLKPMKLYNLKEISYDRILAMAKERTANANGWVFMIMGNFDEQTIRPLICKYLGSLPSKGKNPKSKRVSIVRKGDAHNTFTRSMQTPKAISYMFWRNEKMPYTLENSIKIDIAGQILSMVYIDKIREEAGAAYSCGAQGSSAIDDDEHHMTLLAYCPMKPEMKDEAMHIMKEEVKNLTHTCDASMLANVKELMLKQAKSAVRNNKYWMTVIEAAYKHGLDLHTDYQKIVSEQTPESICEFMKEFLKGTSYITITMLPEE
ncbi:MAG: M16 family metallopeptidase [Prevotella sp.]|jgi:zinc protease